MFLDFRIWTQISADTLSDMIKYSMTHSEQLVSAYIIVQLSVHDSSITIESQVGVVNYLFTFENGFH